MLNRLGWVLVVAICITLLTTASVAAVHGVSSMAANATGNSTMESGNMTNMTSAKELQLKMAQLSSSNKTADMATLAYIWDILL